MWYSASLLFRATHDPALSKPPLWEESIVLIDATDEAQARAAAVLYAEAQQHQYLVDAASKETVKWEFERIERLHEIDAATLVHGVELFSRFLRDSEVASLLTPFE